MAHFQLKPVLTIIHREVLDSLRDWRIVTPTLILTTLFPFIMNFTSGVMFSFLEEYNAELIAERLRIATLAPIALGETAITLPATIGVSLSDGDDAAPEPLIAAADEDMYARKRQRPK